MVLKAMPACFLVTQEFKAGISWPRQFNLELSNKLCKREQLRARQTCFVCKGRELALALCVCNDYHIKAAIIQKKIIG